MIVIIGDSWGLGEWQDGYLVHPGIGGYLAQDGHAVLNLARSQGSNMDAWRHFRNWLIANPWYRDQIETVLVFQTEWTRDYDIWVHQYSIYDNVHLLDTVDTMMWDFYQNLDALNLPIKMIGGCADIIDRSLDLHNVSVACQSMTNLLVHSNPITEQPVLALWTGYAQHLDAIKQRLADSASLEKLLDSIDLGIRRHQQWCSRQDLFFPDGIHANRQSHRVLYDYLRTQGCFISK